MKASRIQEAFEQGGGILRLMPTFVTMNFNQAGGRLRLHPEDWFPRGLQAGSVKERWLSSTLEPRKGTTEGTSFVSLPDQPEERGALQSARAALPEVVETLGADLVGAGYWQTYQGWPIHAKFFDYHQPLFLHLHLDMEAAARIGTAGKPEAYYFPLQLNNHPGAFPVTYFGFAPGVTRAEVLARLQAWEQRDVRINDLSRGYQLEVGTGWYTPPGVLHAPGSLLTYEVQWNSASGAVYQNVLSSGEIYGLNSLTANCPERKLDWDYVMGLIDWDVNVDPLYREHYFRSPVVAAQEPPGYSEKWITYGNPYFGAKELSVQPGQAVTVRDERAYGCVVVQGHGRLGEWAAEAPGLLRFGQLSADEFMVSEGAAQRGVRVQNESKIEPLVILKHFGPGYPGMP